MRIIICAPIQSCDHSNGILALVHLGKSLEKNGINVSFCVMGEGLQSEYIINVPKIFTTGRTRDSYEYHLASRLERVIKKFNINLLLNYDYKDVADAIVLYPETILGNPLKSERVIRYFGNKNGVLVDEVNCSGREYVISHSRSIHDTADQYLFFAYIDPVFNPTKILNFKERKFSSFYIGKGNLYTNPHYFDDAIEITRHWPSKKQQLAILLQNSQFFFTYDSWTNTNVEAILCGAIPVYLHNGPFTDDEIDSAEFGVIPRIKFNEEIRVDDDFLGNFEAQRIELINRIKLVHSEWDSGVLNLIKNVKDKFY